MVWSAGRLEVHGSAFVAQRGVEIELEGSSASGIQEAVEAAFDAAPDTLGSIRSAELKSLRLDVAERGERRWSVTLTTRLQT